MTPLTPHNDDPEMKATMSKTRFLLLSLVAIVAISFGAILLFQFVAGDTAYSAEWELKRSRSGVGFMDEHFHGQCTIFKERAHGRLDWIYDDRVGRSEWQRRI
jgi:hypothetical protein